MPQRLNCMLLKMQLAGLIPLVQKYGVSWVLLFLSEFLISFDASAKLALKLIKNSDKNNNTQETPYFCTRGIRPASCILSSMQFSLCGMIPVTI